MQTWLTPTSFCGAAIKETLEDFFHYLYFYYNFFLTSFPYKLIKFQLNLLNKLQM
jgi:hypothetical protein